MFIKVRSGTKRKCFDKPLLLLRKTNQLARTEIEGVEASGNTASRMNFISFSLSDFREGVRTMARLEESSLSVLHEFN